MGLLTVLLVLGVGSYHEVTYPPSDKPGELRFGVTYTVWIPEAAAKLRGVIVHPHGCGAGACKGGATAAYDLHWQALSYHDTPERPLPEMRFVDRAPAPGARHEYRRVVVNGRELKSEPSAPATIP